MKSNNQNKLSGSQPPSDWFLILLVFVIGLNAAAQVIKISLTLHPLSIEFNRSLPEISILVSLVGLISILFGLVTGNIVAAFGARRVMLIALLIGALTSLLEALLPQFLLMSILRLIEGFSHLALVVAAPAMLARVANDRDRPIAMALWAMFFGMAFAIGTVVIPKLLAWGGLQLLFASHGFFLLILTLLLAWRAPYSKKMPLNLKFLSTHFTTYSTPELCTPGLGFVFYTFIYVAFLTFLPDVVSHQSWQFWLPLLSLTATLLAGWLARFLNVLTISLIGFSMIVAGGFAVLANFELAIWIMFIGLGLVPAAQFAMIPVLNVSEADRAIAAGAIAQMGNIGTASGTPVFAILMVWGGPNFLLLSILIAAGTGFLTVFLLSLYLKVRNSINY
ncbi:MAG: MFS transporter [Planktomarina sp.]|nr:MFS transporter [Planktomarina sp.]